MITAVNFNKYNESCHKHSEYKKNMFSIKPSVYFQKTTVK